MRRKGKYAVITMFMFGYWGWGNAVHHLIRSIDAVEENRGFAPPVFVDIRVHRAVRAAGFAGDTFEKALGAGRYRWMRELGNRMAMPGAGARAGRQGISIVSPHASEELLRFAIDAARKQRRIVFFCSCETPRVCHRFAVADLLSQAARRAGRSLHVIEWPGTVPRGIPTDVNVPPQKARGSSRLMLQGVSPLWKFAGLAFGDTVEVVRGGRTAVVPVGPARYAPLGWYLPLLREDDGTPVQTTTAAVMAWRQRRGYDRED